MEANKFFFAQLGFWHHSTLIFYFSDGCMTFIYPQMAHLLNDFIQVVNEGNQNGVYY